MESLPSIALICEGDGETTAFSGSARGMVLGLRAAGHEVRCVNASPNRWKRTFNAVRTFSPDRGRWQAKFRYGPAAFQARSRRVREQLSLLVPRPDFLLQIGATFRPPVESDVPYGVYCDWNMALSLRHGSIGRLSRDEGRRINAWQSAVYERAAVIFTICDRLRQSFIDDYAVSPDRVILAYAGVNIATTVPTREVRRDGQRPTVLFIGKEFRRKGGDVLLAAFATLRHSIPNARLVLVGVDNAGPLPRGVENLGSLRKGVPAEHERLLRAFAEADVFCLPSRHDPFPNVVREAMYFGLPCVTTDVWAFPEMVRDGETGFTVPAGDSNTLATRLRFLLQNSDIARRMGNAGQARALRLFDWTTTGHTMSSHVQAAIVENGRTTAPLTEAT